MWVYCFTGLQCSYDLRLEAYPNRLQKIFLIGLVVYTTLTLVYFVIANITNENTYALVLYLNIMILIFSSISLAITSYFIKSVREIINDSRKQGNAIKIDSLSFIVNLFLFAGAVIAQFAIVVSQLTGATYTFEVNLWHSFIFAAQLTFCYICFKMNSRKEYLQHRVSKNGLVTLEIQTVQVGRFSDKSTWRTTSESENPYLSSVVSEAERGSSFMKNRAARGASFIH